MDPVSRPEPMITGTGQDLQHRVMSCGDSLLASKAAPACGSGQAQVEKNRALRLIQPFGAGSCLARAEDLVIVDLNLALMNRDCIGGFFEGMRWAFVMHTRPHFSTRTYQAAERRRESRH